MAIVRKACGEGRPIVESVRFAAKREFNLPVKGVDFPPSIEDNALFRREVNGHDGVVSRSVGVAVEKAVGGNFLR